VAVFFIMPHLPPAWGIGRESFTRSGHAFARIAVGDDFWVLRSMKPTHAGPLRASVRPAARGGDLAATSQFCGTPSTPRIRQKKPWSML